MRMSSKQYVSIVASILLSPHNHGKHVKGFKKEYPPLPWYTGKEMEEIREEEQRITDTQQPVPEEDPVLQTLRQKDLKMKRTISEFLSDNDSKVENKSKRVCIEETEFRSSSSSDEMVTPTEYLSPVDPPPTEVAKINISGCFRLDEDSDIDVSEVETISDMGRSQTTYKDTNQQSNVDDNVNKSGDTLDVSTESHDGIVTDTITANNSTETDTDITTSSPNVKTTQHKDTPALTEEEIADINRKSFILHYESMCRVVGLSKEEGDNFLKEWQEEEEGSKAKPAGILKNPKERFDIKSDTVLSSSLITPPADKTVSFCLPQTSETTNINPVSSKPDSISITPLHSNVPTTSPLLTTPSPAVQEPTTPILTVSPPTLSIRSALMSTPILNVPIPNNGTGPVSSASFPKPPRISQDISMIPSVSTQTLQYSTPSLPSSQMFRPPTPRTQSLPTSFLANLITNPSLQTNPASFPSNPSSSSVPFNPLAFLSQEQSKQQTDSNKPSLLPTQSSSLLSTPLSVQDSNNLFKLSTVSSSSSSLFPTFLQTSAPVTTQTVSSVSSPFLLSSSTTSISTSTPIPSFLSAQTSKLNPLQSATSLQLKSNKPFHNLELSYSIPTTSKSNFTVAPTHSSTVPSSLSLPHSSSSSFKPMLAAGSPFKPLATSFPIRDPLLSSTPALTKPAITSQTNQVPGPAFQFNPSSLTQSPIPTATAFTPGLPINFNFGTDTNSSAIFLGQGAGPAPATRSSAPSPHRFRGIMHKKKKK